MIPRKLHQVWLGPKEPPTKWTSEWERLHPGWEYRLWREADLADMPMLNRRAFDEYVEKRAWVGASDIARMAILREHGGVYADADSRPLRSLEGAPFMAADFFAAYEPVASLPGRVAAGTVGAAANTTDHSVFRTLAMLIDGMPDLTQVWDTAGGTGLTAALLAHRQCCSPLILPSRTFYPTDAQGKPVPGGEAPYCEHFWATTNRAYFPDTVILVPRRKGDAFREEAWAFARAEWEKLEWPVFVGEHKGQAPFNAAMARNRAAAAAAAAGDWEVAVFADADTVMLDTRSVVEAVQRAHKTGRFTRPYTSYWMTDEVSRGELLAGRRPHARQLRPDDAHGGVNVIPRPLWDRLGGYDERFRGWGYEDAAIEAAAKALGKFEVVAGDVFHIWHPLSPDRGAQEPTLKANAALFDRYRLARRPRAMEELLAQAHGRPRPTLTVQAVVITNGRRELIAKTIPSLEAAAGPFAERLICDDSGDPTYAAWLRAEFPSWRVFAHPHLGHGPAVAAAMAEAARADVDWTFWTEDDYEFPRKLDLAAVADVMEAEGDDLKQMSFKRQAWFPVEVEAGGLIERFDQRLFVETETLGHPWISHRQFFTLNPHLIMQRMLGAIAPKWPAVPNSEHHFGVKLFQAARARCGIWGAKADPPWVIHGGERTGTGY